jgi:hypothetical protein
MSERGVDRYRQGVYQRAKLVRQLIHIERFFVDEEFAPFAEESPPGAFVKLARPGKGKQGAAARTWQAHAVLLEVSDELARVRG